MGAEAGKHARRVRSTGLEVRGPAVREHTDKGRWPRMAGTRQALIGPESGLSCKARQGGRPGSRLLCDSRNTVTCLSDTIPYHPAYRSVLL